VNHLALAGVAVRENSVGSQSRPIYDTFDSVARPAFFHGCLPARCPSVKKQSIN
jgi:hypothetical protein